MQDDEILFELKLTNEEYEYLQKVKQKYCEKLSKMTKDERLQYIKNNYCDEQNLNFEKEINGTIYKVNTYFNTDATHTVLSRLIEIFENS